MLKLRSFSLRSKWVLASLLVLGLIAGILRYGLFSSNFDKSAPIVYGLDGILTATMVQGLIEKDYFPPGVVKASRLGAPGHMSLGDFPTFDGFHLLAVKFISLFTSKPFLICNLYFILSFFLSGLVFLWVALAFRIRTPLSIAGAVLFAFGHYRIFRSQHLFLASYYIIPALIWMMVQSWTPKPLSLKDRRLIPILVIAAIGGGSGIYFTAFFLVLAVACAIHSAFFYRSWRRFVSSIFPAIALFVFFLVGAAPNLAHRYTYGKTMMGARHFDEAEVLGLTLPEAVLPVAGASNIPWVNEHIAGKYKPLFPITDAAYLGAWASVGFILVLCFGLFYGANIAQNIPAQFGFMALIALLYALRGGFGLMYSILVSPQIRALSRIVVFMAPLGLLGLSAFLSEWIKPRWLVAVIAGVVLVTGVVDQVPYRSLTNNPSFLAEYRKDQIFFPRLEKELPMGSSVLQLPVVEFPEGGTKEKIPDYDQLRPYLHTKTLHWSGGAVSYRDTIKVLKNLSAMPMDLGAIERAGFSSVLIDHFGYPDHGKEIDGYLRGKLKQEPLISEDGRWVSFKIAGRLPD